MPLAPGTRVGRFKLAELLGKGGMGEVYRAEDSVLGRAVALKVLRADGPLGTTPPSGSSVKLLHEARAAAALNHPNAVAIFDVGEADGVAYIAMELLSGRSLRGYVHDAPDAHVPLGKRLGWLLDVATALEAAHKRGIVHRDIKPENVFVRDDGVVKVLDFGIARRVSAPVDPTAATQGGEVTMTATGASVDAGDGAGTPLYMAPEQLRGELLDGATDQFAWGVLAYEVLTGEPPWETAQGALQLVSQILSRDPPPPSAKRAEVAPEVDRIVMRALAKVPSDRFASMGDLIGELQVARGESASRSRAARDAPTVPPADATTFPSGGTGGGPRRRVAVFAFVGAVALAVVLAVGVAVVHRAQRGSPALVASDASSVHTGPAAGPPDWGSKMSTNEAAMAAYRAGMQATIDASQHSAILSFERAAELDPSFAAAHLRRALAPTGPEDDVARDHYDKAFALRADLGAHDRSLLEAVSAVLRRSEGAAEDMQKRLGELETAPDADARFVACYLRSKALDDFPNAVRACRATWQVDPMHAGAHWLEGEAHAEQREAEAARDAFNECLRLSPSSTACMYRLWLLDSEDGRCPEAVTLARQLIAREPASAAWRGALAVTLYDVGVPIESYEEAMRQYFDRLTGVDRGLGEPPLRFRLAVARGAFREAQQHLLEWDRVIATDQHELFDHWEIFRSAFLLDLEEGNPRAAGELAEQYQKHRAAWDTRGDEAGGLVLAALYVSGRLGRAELVKKRDAWYAKRTEPMSFDWWVNGFAQAVVTHDDAREALAALDRFGGVPAQAVSLDEYALGSVLLRAGETEKAIPFLTRAAHSCTAIRIPFDQTHAYAELGSALSLVGDVAGACAAYRTVLSRWGNASPRSITADSSRQAAAKLGCSP